MTLSFKDLLPFLVLFGTAALTRYLGLPFWATLVVTTLVFSATLGLLAWLSRRFRASGLAAPVDEPERAAADVAALLRRLADDTQFHDRGLFVAFTLPGADAAAVLSGRFTREDGGTWPVWRHLGNVCIEVPARLLEDGANDLWRRFLARLPRGLQRWRLHGVLVLAPLSADAAREQDARLVQARAASLLRRIGATAPTYVLLAGADACATTTATPFTPLDESAAGWGATVPELPPLEISARVAALLADLAERLTRSALGELVDAAVARIDDQIVRNLRSEQYGYAEPPADEAAPPAPQIPDWRGVVTAPRQLLAHTAAVQRLMNLLFAADARSGLRFAGLFLIAAGAPARFAANALECIEANRAQHAAPSVAALDRRRRRAWQLATAVTLVQLAFAAVVVRGWLRDGAATTQAWTAFREFQRAGHTPLPISALRQFAGQIHLLERKEPAWLAASLGLDSRSRLATTLRRHLHDVLHGALFVPVVRRVEQTLRRTAEQPHVAPDTGALLPFYLLATWLPDGQAGQLGRRAPGEPDPTEISDLRAFTRAAVRTLGDVLPPGQQDLAVDLISAEFRAMKLRNPRLPRDEPLVASLRARLLQQQATACTWPEIHRALAPSPLSLATLLAATDRTHDFRAESTPDDSHTARGMRRVLAELGGPRCVALPAWILGLTEAEAATRAQTLRSAVLREYAAAFVAAWQRMYTGLRLATQDRECRTLTTALQHLADREGPLHRLSQVLQTELAALPGVGVDTRTDSLSQLLARAAAPPTADPAAFIRAELAPYTHPLTPEPGPLGEPAKAPLEPLLAALEKHVAVYQAVMNSQLEQQSRDAGAALAHAYRGFDPAVLAMYRRLLDPLLTDLEPCLGLGGPPELPAWCIEVYQPFHQTLAGYPFEASAHEVAVEDLCQFFCHERGSAWRYFHAHFATRMVLHANGRFIAAVRAGASLLRHYNMPALGTFYTHARRISQQLFVGLETTPRVRLATYVPPIEAPGVEIAEVVLELGDQAALFHNTRPRPQDLVWPSPAGGAALVVRGRYFGAKIEARLAADGAWALFRLLERASAVRHDDRLTYTFSLNELPGVPIVVEIQSSAAALFVDDSGVVMGAWRFAPPAKERKRSPACVR